MGVFIGIDIGGTKMMVASVREDMQIVERRREATPQDWSAALARLDHMIAEVALGEPVLAMGMACGGPIDPEAGTVSPLNLPQWRDVPVKAHFESRWKCPFYFGVDTDVAAIAEYDLAGLACERFLYLTISTGVGGGFLLNGQVYRGTHGIHPEVGHMALPARVSHPERVRCGCGNTDCLEALVSGSGIQRIYQKPAAELNPSEWDEVAYNLSLGLRNLIMVLGPDLIVLGGGVTTGGGAFFLEQALQYLRERLTLAHLPEIRVSDLGYDTALLGALYLARRPEALG